MITQKDWDEIEAIVDPGEGYRLLANGEPIRPSDEFLCGDTWTPTNELNGAICFGSTPFYRRRLQTKPEPTGQWIPIGERNPEFPCNLYSYELGYDFVLDEAQFKESMQTIGRYTHWSPLPPDPKPDDEAAFKEWWESSRPYHVMVNDDAKSGFLAGLALGRKEK